eukprot:TRINITY_DN889_c0_g1_i1.p4 TRINITY_DN889_c0_g1~~TRINITY_DN889_c0_g1_i1.p4  ORF type:complete len:100 (-),score=6.91 TRINITY_DN889_c0_g1_i1:69-368(-)
MEIKRDSASSGERTRTRANRWDSSQRGCRTPIWDRARQQKDLERSPIQGDRPVSEIEIDPRVFLSTTGHVKPGRKLGGPPSNPKYYCATDSEPVPWGGE